MRGGLKYLYSYLGGYCRFAMYLELADACPRSSVSGTYSNPAVKCCDVSSIHTVLDPNVVCDLFVSASSSATVAREAVAVDDGIVWDTQWDGGLSSLLGVQFMHNFVMPVEGVAGAYRQAGSGEH
jgi:hypothetical protein